MLDYAVIYYSNNFALSNVDSNKDMGWIYMKNRHSFCAYEWFRSSLGTNIVAPLSFGSNAARELQNTECKEC